MTQLTDEEKRAIQEYEAKHTVRKLPDGDAHFAHALRKWDSWPLGGLMYPTYKDAVDNDDPYDEHTRRKPTGYER